MIGQQEYEEWRQSTIEFTKVVAEYSAGNRKAGVQARKLSIIIAGQLKAWRNASLEHDKIASGKVPEATVAVDEMEN